MSLQPQLCLDVFCVIVLSEKIIIFWGPHLGLVVLQLSSRHVFQVDYVTIIFKTVVPSVH